MNKKERTGQSEILGKALADWIIDIFLRRDVTMLKIFAEEKEH
ncbi:MAG TPA: hypothetical protein VEL70_09125 [Candidatus Acidoferrum sp.]|nr:hypothetical protein [Candidatus Acidoferrum sp.]